MADGTEIEWTDATWNIITGCSIKSPGCKGCYAMKLAGTRLRHHPSRVGLTTATNAGPVWNGEARFNEEWLDQPLRWKRPRRIFVCAHGDLFHESVPDEWIDRIFAVMTLCPQHVFQVLTKRAARMRSYLDDISTPIRICKETVNLATTDALRFRNPAGTDGWWPLPNVWLGVSVENQAAADERIPELLATPASVRWISAEPLLSKLCIIDHLGPWIPTGRDYGMDWVVAGGESGRGARPAHPDWFRSLRDQCAGAGVPFFFKQHGEWSVVYDRDKDDPDWRNCPKAEDNSERYVNLAGGHGFHGERVVFMRAVGKKASGRLLDGVEHLAMPEKRTWA